MNKKIRITIWATIIGIILLLAIIIGIFFATGVFQQAVSSGVNTNIPSGCKSSILSIDKVSLSRSSSDLGEEVFLITLSGREGGQCIYGYLDSNDLTQKIGNVIGKDVKTKYSSPFLISLNRIETNAYYKINADIEKKIYYYKYVPFSSPIATFSGGITTCKIGSLVQKSCSKQCTEKGYKYSNCENTASTTGCFCWDFPVIKGNIYGFNGDRLQEKINVEIKTGDGGSNSVSLDTNSKLDSYNQQFRDGLYVTFEGFMQGNNILPSANAKVYDSEGIKKIVTSSAGSTASQDPNCQNQNNYKLIESCMLTYNKDLDIGFNTPSEFSKATISGSEIKLPISKDTFYPIIKIQLKAKWLGIYEPIAEPKLSNCNSVTTEFRNQKETIATYNLGIKEGTGSEGTFNIYTSCSNSGFKVMQNEDSKTITGLQTSSGQIRVIQQENKDSSSSCTIKASIQRLGFTAEDSCSFTATGKASCSLESEKCGTGCCEGLECREDICRKQVGVEICYNKEDDDGNGLIDCLDPNCKNSGYCGGTPAPEIKKKCAWYDITCKLNDFLDKFKIIFAVVIGLLTGIFAWLFSDKIVYAISKSKSTWWVGLLIGFIFAIALFLVALIYFWTSLIILVITLVLMIIIKVAL